MDTTALLQEKHMDYLLVKGVEEIVGEKDTKRVMRQAKKLETNYSHTSATRVAEKMNLLNTLAIEQALQNVYGCNGGRGVAQRAGQAAFKSLLQKYGEEMGLRSLDFRLLPSNKRIRIGLEALAKIYQQLCLAVVQIEEEDAHWLWMVKENGHDARKWDGSVICHFTIGLLQGFLGWISAGKVFDVRERPCTPEMGVKCVIQLSKISLD